MNTNTVAKDQNHPDNILLLKAQRQLYTEAKKWMSFRLIISLLFLAFPVFAAIFPWLNDYNLPVTFLAAVASLFFPFYIKDLERKKALKASHVQDRFDRRLFRLDTNESLYDAVASLDDIDNALKRFKGDEKRLENWYEDGAIPESIAHKRVALICQRNNLSWDGRLRHNYATLFLLLGAATLITPLALCGAFGKTVTYLLNVLIPLVPFLTLCIDNYINQARISKAQLAKMEEIDSKLETKSAIEQEDLNSAQDAIYKNRKEPYLVPDWFYRIFQKAFENTMKNVTIAFTKDS